MGRKIVIVMLTIALIVSPAATETAHSASIQQRAIDGTFLSYAKDIISGLSVDKDYVFFRTSDTEHILITGDLDYNGTFILNGNGKQYTLSATYSYVTRSHYPTMHVVDTSVFSLNPYNLIVYSNLGNYPTLSDRGDVYDFTTVFILSVMCLCMFIRPIFSFTYRNGNRIHG